MARFRICLLGNFETRAGTLPIALHLPKKALGLLAFLATRPGQACSRDKLAGLLWGDDTTDQARHSLRQALVSLRRAFAAWPALIVAEGDTLAFASSEGDVDVAAFEHLVALGDWSSLEQGATLYRGDFLEGFYLNEAAFEEWSVGERERLRELAVEAIARLLEHQHQDSAAATAIHTALRLLRLDGTQEAVHRTLIRLYARQGRRAEALRQYQVCVNALRRELGIEPEAETVRLYREIVQKRPARTFSEA